MMLFCRKISFYVNKQLIVVFTAEVFIISGNEDVAISLFTKWCKTFKQQRKIYERVLIKDEHSVNMYVKMS